ncbi:MAG: cyclic nucleotide-binding protein, partial [Sphingobacterium sp.]
RAWMAYELYLSKKRATEMITEPAKKRYLHLLEEKPHIIQQAPLKFVATFLGITDTSLSRIRKEIANGHS